MRALEKLRAATQPRQGLVINPKPSNRIKIHLFFANR
jgi:hypothetical protein